MLEIIIKKNLTKILTNVSLPLIEVEICENKFNAHYSTNILLKIKKHITEEILKEILSSFQNNIYIKKVEILNFYLNFTVSENYFKYCFENFEMFKNIGNQKFVNIEYCSLNPTGLMHIGHARNAVIGESIARIYEKLNFKVTKEYYINNAGNQINLLADSIKCRYNQQTNPNLEFIENGYIAQEIIDLAKKLKGNETKEQIKELGVKFFLNNIKKDLKKIGIKHDKFVFETDIIKKNYMEKAFNVFKKQNLIIEEIREEKQNEKGSISKLPLMLLKTTEFGDDLNRPLTKEDGSWTYFATDIGYHFYKIKRKYKKLITILGADHDSYATRIKIATNLLNKELDYEIIKCQMVSFENHGKIVKFSKRKGGSLYLRDFIKKIDQNVLKFMLLDQTAGNAFTFNFENAMNMSMQNPIFYCNYAFARANSLMQHFNTNESNNIKISFEIFNNNLIQQLLINLFNFPYILEKVYLTNNLCFLTKYLIKISQNFHQIWQEGKLNNENKIITENKDLSNQKLKIIEFFLKIAKESFECLNIIPLNAM